MVGALQVPEVDFSTQYPSGEPLSLCVAQKVDAYPDLSGQ